MVSIGIGQIEPRLMDCAYNIQQLKVILTEAKSSGIEVFVLPELSNSGYAFESDDEAQVCAESIPEGEFSQILREWTIDNRLVVAGVCEKTSEGLYNSAVVFANGKHITTYRKVHLFN
ncbi:MAG: nitrilase-related carbon-nitrogen hydrolase, partial [Candidatus Thorarchaeota archaeon]